MLEYDDVTVPLLQTDLDMLSNRSAQSVSGGALKAVKLEFSLPSSSYATMAVRELLKTDTSPVYQASLNQ